MNNVDKVRLREEKKKRSNRDRSESSIGRYLHLIFRYVHIILHSSTMYCERERKQKIDRCLAKMEMNLTLNLLLFNGLAGILPVAGFTLEINHKLKSQTETFHLVYT